MRYRPPFIDQPGLELVELRDVDSATQGHLGLHRRGMVHSPRSSADRTAVSDNTSAAPTPRRLGVLQVIGKATGIALGVGALGGGIAVVKELPIQIVAAALLITAIVALLVAGALTGPTILMTWVAVRDSNAREELYRLHERVHETVVDLRHGRKDPQKTCVTERGGHRPLVPRDRPPGADQPYPQGASGRRPRERRRGARRRT